MAICRLFLILSLFSSAVLAETIFSTLATTPKVTTAKIRRGDKTIPIDLSSSQAKSQIKDYDVIELSEGVYSTLGDFTAKYVRVRGLGPRKTFISSMAKGSTPILINSTEFWDLTMADAQFKIYDVNGLWAVNVEFAGAILVRPSALDKTPAFAIRSVFSDLTNSDIPADDNLYSHLLSKPILQEKPRPADVLAQEDKFDKTKDINLKNRIGYKGLFARGLNYLYQKQKLTPQYDQAKYNQLVKNARATKSKGHLYVSMLYWAEADRLSGHSRFDEVLKEITPLNQSLNQEYGCTVEAQGLARSTKSEIEQKLYAQIPITALPGSCKIQTLHVKVPPGGKKAELISAARLRAETEKAIAFRESEDRFQKSVIAHASGQATEDEFLMAAGAPIPMKEYTAVADVDLGSFKQSYTSDVLLKKNAVEQDIVNPIIKILKEKLASKLKAAKFKIASSDLFAKFDGLMTQLLYGDEPAKDKAYDDLFEQQFGRKVSAEGAMSSVFAY